MNKFRLIGLLILALQLVGCDFPDNATVLIVNNSSENIFYGYGNKRDGIGKKIDGKKIVYSMGTLKPQDSKEFTDIGYEKWMTNDAWFFIVNFNIGEAYYAISHYTGEGRTINIDITDTLLKELNSYRTSHGRPPLGFSIYAPPDPQPYSATNFYGFLTGGEKDDFYLFLDGVVHLADRSEEKLVEQD